MQKAKPANATGVPVSIDALDPNGNLVHLGDATSDANGQYYLKVKADAFSAGAGTYTVMANFAGTNSYYRSSAETFLSFDEAAPTVSPIQLAAQPNTEMYIVGAAVAIIITIVIVAAILLMAIRRRP
jgi:hypothetical protein